MTRQLALAWHLQRLPCKRGKGVVETWAEVETVLDSVRRYSGTATLRIVNPPDIGPERVEAPADDGKFLVSLLEYTEDDWDIRSHTDHAVGPDVSGKANILGDFWHPRMVTTDFAIVMAAFREFFETGNVSETLLD